MDGDPPEKTAGLSGAANRQEYRWVILGVGVAAQAAMSALQHGLPALGPMLRTTYGLTLTEVGMVLASANWGIMATLMFWGWLADRRGEKIVVAIGLGGSAVALLGAAATDDLGALVVMLAVAGGFGASAAAASGRAVMGWFSRSERGFALGIRQMAVPLGGASAALVLPSLALVWGLGAAMIALALAAAAGALVAGLWLHPPLTDAVVARQPADQPSPLRDRPMWRLAICSGLFVSAQVALSAFVVIFMNEHRGLAPTTAAAVLALIQIGGGIARIVSGRFSDRSGRRIPQLRLHGSALVVMLLATALLVDAPLPWLLPALVVAGILTLSWNGLAFTATAEMAGHRQAGLALGLQGTVMRGVSAGAGVAFGALVGVSTWGVAFAALALAPALGWLLMKPLVAEEHRRTEAAPPR